MDLVEDHKVALNGRGEISKLGSETRASPTAVPRFTPPRPRCPDTHFASTIHRTMAGLFSLPNEALSEIYIFAGQDARALVRLSAVNRLSRAIWLQDSANIIAQSLELQALSHQDAIVLTMLETRCPMHVPGFHQID